MTITVSGERALRTEHVGAFALEDCTRLRDVRVAYHLDGPEVARRAGVIVVVHSLTAGADAAGDWWGDVIGAGMGIDTDRYAVVAPNLLGSCYGTTYATDGPNVPAVTTRDQARLIAVLLERLGVSTVTLATGGSLGGMVALELAVSHRRLVERAVVFGAPAIATPWAVAWNQVQRRALDVGGADGLAVAREIAMISYRTEAGFDERFGGGVRGGTAATGWLRHHGAALTSRFDARAYRTLLQAMDSHDVTRGRGDLATAIAAAGTRVWGVGIGGDTLYSPSVVQAWVAAAGGTYRHIETIHGHDGFLIEQDQVGAILRAALDTTCGITPDGIAADIAQVAA